MFFFFHTRCVLWDVDLIFSPLFYSHIECSKVQSFLSAKDAMLLSSAATVVVKEILFMYRNMLAFLHSVVQLDTIFCFDLLQDQEALDRIVQLYSLRSPCTGKVGVVIQLYKCQNSKWIFAEYHSIRILKGDVTKT